MLPGNKENMKSDFKFGEVNTQRKTVRVGENENLEKALFDWFKRIRIRNLLISGTILKEESNQPCTRTAS